jgi:hypothetical protein
VRHNTSSTQIPGNDELELQRRGNARHLTIEDREAAARGLAILGYSDVARRLRNLNDCLTRRARITVVPPDGRRPLKAGHDRPLLVVLPGGGTGEEQDVDHAAVAWGRVARVAEHSLLTLALDPVDASELRLLANEARSAAAPQQSPPA